jgi:hypothetical protein
MGTHPTVKSSFDMTTSFGDSKIVGIDWKEGTSSMTDEDFKAELTLFAGHVEQKKARGILVDVSRFRHKPGPEV